MPGEVIAIIAGVIAVIALIIFLAHQAEQKRIAKFRETAIELGFEYLETLPLETDGQRGRFELFNTGRGRKATNILRRVVGDLSVLVFDYGYTVGSGKHQRRHMQTVVMFRHLDVRFPKFRLTPEGWLSKLGAIFGSKDFDFQDDIAFSKAFVLSGTDEQAVRELFQAEQRSLLCQHPTFSAEAADDCLIVWTQSRRIEPKDTKAFFEQAFEVFSSLKRS